jgi:CTP synthase (UTP-ammonia lyase)
MLPIGLIGDYDPRVTAHVAIPQALALAATALGDSVDAVEPQWLPTPDLAGAAPGTPAAYAALWAIPGTPYASMEGALRAIRYAREHATPLLGTCGGFQHMLIEYARTVLGIRDADHAESHPDAATLLVAPLSCSVSEQSTTCTLTPGSRVAALYGATQIVEQYGICNYGLNAAFRPLFEGSGLQVTGRDEQGDARIALLDAHPYFVGTLFQPERSAFRGVAHPLVEALLRAAVR